MTTERGAQEVRIVVERRSGLEGWSVFDGDEWFAHATTISGALGYATDLLYGPGAGPRAAVDQLLRDLEVE